MNYSSLISENNKKVHAFHLTNKWTFYATGLLQTVSRYVHPCELKTLVPLVTQNQKASSQPSHFMAVLLPCSRRSFILTAKMCATNTLVNHQWKQQKASNRIRHLPAAASIMLGSHMRFKNIRVTGHTKQKSLIPTQLLYDFPPSLQQKRLYDSCKNVGHKHSRHLSVKTTERSMPSTSQSAVSR